MRELRVAVEGCGHGTLDEIYAAVTASCKAKGWDSVDLLIIGGDFQAVRNAADLNCMAVPAKYRVIGDFHKYYSGECTAPYLTLFVGGNHEASNHLRELYYGGWVAPNIYYHGAANVVQLGGVRIAGLSGIWKGYNYNKPHFERIPMNGDEVRSIYSVRELDVRKLLQIRSQVDIGISHDWPRGIEWAGNFQQLFHWKKHLESDAFAGNLGSVAARYLLDYLRPSYWFSAHLHTKFSAIVGHDGPDESRPEAAHGTANGDTNNNAPEHNSDEIDLEMDNEEDLAEPVANSANETSNEANAIPEDLRSQLPASFAKPTLQPLEADPPTTIMNNKTNFLALDKCLPKRDFLQLLEIPAEIEDTKPLRLHYDPEWLSILRAFSKSEPLLTSPDAKSYPKKSKAQYATLIDEAANWIQENVSKDKLEIPLNFELMAPPYQGENVMSSELPWEYNNPQTVTFCEMLGIDNEVWVDDEEAKSRREKGPATERTDRKDSSFRGYHQNRGRGFDRGGGRGRGSWRGGGRGRGRGHRGGRGGGW